jgi:hypothetical protein
MTASTITVIKGERIMGHTHAAGIEIKSKAGRD